MFLKSLSRYFSPSDATVLLKRLVPKGRFPLHRCFHCNGDKLGSDRGGTGFLRGLYSIKSEGFDGSFNGRWVSYRISVTHTAPHA